MRSLVLVPDGVSLRNFVLGDAVRLLAERGPVTVWADPALPPPDTDGRAPWACWQRLDPYPERPAEASVRRTLEYGHLRSLDTSGARFNLALPVPGRRRSRALRASARAASRPFGSRDRLAHLATVHERVASRRPEVGVAIDRLRAVQPDVVFCAHQRPLAVLPVILAARRLGVPTATFVFSWDNLTTKGRMAAPFDHHLVWSRHMAGELSRFYPEIGPDRVHVVGTPQFDPYADPALCATRADLAGRLGLDPDRPIICFTGGDEGTCPDDPWHLELLLEQVGAGAVPGRPQVVLRRAPVDRGDRYEGVRRRHPELHEAEPRWRLEAGRGWHEAYPTREDVHLLAALTSGADVNVNMASTMSIDFALRDTPVVNLGFDRDPHEGRARAYYRFEHYRPVVELGAVRVAPDPDALAARIGEYLADPSLDRDGRRALCELEVGVPVGCSSQAVADTLTAIATTT